METLWLLERKEGGKGACDGVARFLYPAKAAAGPCARLARCGGRGFLMRACRLVVYGFNLINSILIVYILFNIFKFSVKKVILYNKSLISLE